MITVRRAAQRQHTLNRRVELWRTFSPRDRTDPLRLGFASLEYFNEFRLRPGAAIPRLLHRDAEVVTYVSEGEIALEQAIRAGEFQRLTTTRGFHRKETNVSRTDWAHAYQLWLRPEAGVLEPGQEQKRFSAAERRGGLCAVASRDGRNGSLRLQQDTTVYSGLLDAGQHVVHALGEGRVAWVHVVAGRVNLQEQLFAMGDSVGLTGERVISFTALEDAEVLVVDLVAPS
jgi:redox-sensitive bicupin YhaK (pirin superfamily)